MAYSPTSPVTGSAQTGFTTPTYTLSVDSFPGNNGKQHAVTALGGTQTGVTTHTPSSPFTISFTKPQSLRTLGQANIAGNGGSIPKNTYKLIVRKGVVPAAGLVAQVAILNCSIDIPAGSDTYDAANVRALISSAIGVLNQISAGIGDTVVTGVM